jgi:uncharacterized membrane protein YqhA
LSKIAARISNSVWIKPLKTQEKNGTLTILAPNDSAVMYLKKNLKQKIKTAIMILVVTFFEVSLSMTFTGALDLVYFSLGILMVSLALYFGSKSKH